MYIYRLAFAAPLALLLFSLARSLSLSLTLPLSLSPPPGIPPLYITQNLQLAQLRFRLHSSPPATNQHFLWQLRQPLIQLVPLNTLETRMQTTVCHVDIAHRDPASPMPQNVNMAKILNKEDDSCPKMG